MPNTRNKPVTIAPGVERAVLSKAQKTFNDLVARIGKQRARLAAWEAAIAPCHQKYTRELVPALETLAELQKQLVNAFDRASFDKELNNSDQRLIDELIVDLAGQLLLERDDPDLKAVYNRHSDTDYDAAAAEDDTKSMLEDVFGIDPGSLDDVMEAAEAEVLENAQRREAEAASNAQARSARRKSAKHRALDARREDDAQRISQSIREVYRKLASALHPDRETDPDERNRKTALMQRVNQAYAKGNLLQLLELQLELEHIDQAALANISEDRLFHYNSILKEQLAELALEIRHVEADVRARFGLTPFQPLSPKSLPREVAREVADIGLAIRALKVDLRAFGDPKSLRLLLTRLRRERRLADIGDMPF